MRDRIEAFVPVAGGLTITLALMLTIGAAAVLVGGTLAPSISTLAAGFSSNGSNALAINMSADQTAVTASGAQLARAAADTS